jgi:DNA-binding NtrC family response regulator
MRYALDRCRLYARYDRPTVFVGPVGAGKTMLARELFRAAKLKGRFVAVGAGELGETLFSDTLFGHVSGAYTGARFTRRGVLSEASGGALLLDDLALMPMVVQAAILSVMDTRRYRPLGSQREELATCRFLFASTIAPAELVERDRLLPDLKSRLGEFVVPVPRLRACEEDIMPIALRCGSEFAAEHGIDADVAFDEESKGLLLAYSWPENIRELRAVVERAVAHAGVKDGVVTVGPRHLPDRIRRFEPTSSERDIELSMGLVEYTLDQVDGNKSEAARQLDAHRNTIRGYTSR